MKTNTFAIILAAGKGERFGSSKQFIKVDNKEIVHYTLENTAPWVDGIVLVLPKGFNDHGKYIMTSTDVYFAEGGETRFDSIKAGFALVPEGVNVMVIDAVRCNTHSKVYANLITCMDHFDAAFPYLPCVNTICRPVGDKLRIFSKVHNAPMDIQTPEMVKYDILKLALEKCSPDDGFSVISMVTSVSSTVKVTAFLGPADNFKITYPHDLLAFVAIIQMKKEIEKHAKVATP